MCTQNVLSLSQRCSTHLPNGRSLSPFDEQFLVWLMPSLLCDKHKGATGLGRSQNCLGALFSETGTASRSVDVETSWLSSFSELKRAVDAVFDADAEIYIRQDGRKDAVREEHVNRNSCVE